MAAAADAFLDRLEPVDREHLVRTGRERSVRPREVVMTQGSPSDSVVLLLQGAVRVVASTPDGSEVTLGLRTGGHLLGTLGALTTPPAPRSATVFAILPSRVRLIPTSAFLQVLHERPRLAVALLADVAEQWRESSQRQLLLGYPPEQRLARLLVDLGRTAGAGPGDRAIDLPLSQTDLAGMIGCSRDTAARALARFRDEGLVTTGRRTVQVLDVDALEARALGSG